MVKDMTTGSPTRLILSFAIPTLIGNIFQQLYNMVDSIIVGKYVGYQSLAAVGVTGGMNFLVLGFVIGLTLGFSMIVAQRFGAGDIKQLRKSIIMSGYLCIAFTVIVTTVSLMLSRWMLEIMDTPDDIIQQSVDYINIIFAGIIVTVFYNLLSAVLRALGDSKVPLYFLIVSSILNIGLDLLLIIVFKAGIKGAAIATVIAQAVSCILCIIYIWKKYPILHFTKEDFIYDSNTVKQLLKMGVPTAFQNSITAIGVMVVQSCINSFGSMTVAGYTAASRVEQLANQSGMSFGFAMATYAGQNRGAGKMDRVKTGLKKCLFLSLIFNIITGVLVIVFSEPLTKLFMSKDDMANPDILNEVLAASKTFLLIVGCSFTILGILFVYRSALQGLGNAAIPFLSGAVELIMRLAITFGLYKTVGYIGVCFAEPVAWIGAVILLVVAYYINVRKIERSLPSKSV